MVIPSAFRKRPEFTINYDWIDVASATGYIEFSGFNSKNSSGDDYVLLDNTTAVRMVGNTATATITNFACNAGQSMDKDFDLTPFQLPRTLEGDAYIVFGIGNSAGIPINGTVVTAKVRKWDGSNEIEIANGVTDTFTINATSDQSRTIKIAIPRTHFKQGEILRLTILVSTTSDAPNNYDFGHNPNNLSHNSLSAGNSRLKIATPFKLDFI